MLQATFAAVRSQAVQGDPGTVVAWQHVPTSAAQVGLVGDRLSALVPLARPA